MGKLNSKIAIITGGARGIGRGIALCCAQEGADMAIADLVVSEEEEIIKEINELGREAIAIKTNITKKRDVEQMVNLTLEKYEKVDILVNNVGGSWRERRSLFFESSEEVWDYAINLNLKGTMRCTRQVIGHMMERQYGRIINISSMAGVNGQAGLADYSAAKAGIIGFTKALAKEVASYGILVNCISPGPIETEDPVLRALRTEKVREKMTKTIYLGRYGNPEEIGCVVAFLASDEATFITGQNIPVDGGWSLGF